MPGEPKASERRIESAQRRAKALDLRKAGASYELIARECGYKNRSRAHEAVNRALRALTQDRAAEVLNLELERLDRLLFGIWETARGGELAAIDRCLRIMERRSALYGLDKLAGATDSASSSAGSIDPALAARMLRAANEPLTPTTSTPDASSAGNIPSDAPPTE